MSKVMQPATYRSRGSVPGTENGECKWPRQGTSLRSIRAFQKAGRIVEEAEGREIMENLIGHEVLF